MITFQEIINRLSHFWEKQGCIIQQGHDIEMGAGTFNPATFLRCLGPEPYKTAYVEPCRRPKDARYGENPNRVHLFHQYQVIIKPSPLEIQEIYLDSLRAIGIDLKNHDIRFVHDDWEGPTLGAWGLGWEVWMDGMEITQFTYFQAMGSIPLHPISVEITYGLERLAMYIQNVNSIFDIHWNNKLTFGELSKRSEWEWSTYNFEMASIDMWMDHFNDFENEAKSLISAGLPIPAYDFVMKASHAFNILDARGAISVTERTGYIARIRDLARLIAEKYIISREKLGFPLLAAQKKEKEVELPIVSTVFDPEKKRDLLFEIGSEELPAAFIPLASSDLERKIKTLLEENSLSFDTVRSYAAPRRLAVVVENLSEGKKESITERKGPAIASAFDENGHLTKQGQGFFHSLGLPAITLGEISSVPALKIQSNKGVDFLSVQEKKPGVATAKILAEHLPKIISDLFFPKRMRWSDEEVTYARPVHWAVALFGKEVVPFRYGRIVSGDTTYGHRQLSPKAIKVTEPKAYLSQLRSAYVLADASERKKIILEQLREIEKEHQAQIVEENKVLSQVLYLSEWPMCLTASFSNEFLKAPKEVLASEMIEHQKYFPLSSKEGKLQNRFVVTADNTPSDEIRKGNERVLSARLSDGVFLYEQDLKVPLEEFNNKLKTMTFQKDLGMMSEKVGRIEDIALFLHDFLKKGDKKLIARAAKLCKADLASTMVGEFPELQGVIGKYYAEAQKEPEEVAAAILEHWLPKFENGPLPGTTTGIILSLADKIDNILGYYSVGLKPSSSSDPYALRRQMIGLCKIAIDNHLSLPIKQILQKKADLYPKMENKAETIEEVLAFIKTRLKTVLEEKGFHKEEIEAGLSYADLDPYDNYRRVMALKSFKGSGEFPKLYEVYKRAKGQLEGQPPISVDFALSKEPSEINISKAIQTIDPVFQGALSEKNYLKAFECLSTLQQPLSQLFEEVKILHDDPAIRKHRIGLLQKIFSYFEELMDLSKIGQK